MKVYLVVGAHYGCYGETVKSLDVFTDRKKAQAYMDKKNKKAKYLSYMLKTKTVKES